MTLRFIDGANGYDTAQAVALRAKGYTAWSSGITIDPTNGRHSSPCIRFSNWIQRIVVLPNGNLQSTMILGFALKIAALPTVTKLIARFRVAAGDQCSICITNTGTIEAHTGDQTGAILGTSIAAVVAGTYCYLETKVVIHDTTGSIEVRKDGIAILSLTNVDTRVFSGDYVESVAFSIATNTSEAATIDIDDIYICDGSGIINNNFLGDLRVDAVFPNGAGNSSMFTPSTGSNWQNVDDNPADDDVTYNVANAIGAIDLYAFPDIAPTVGTVFGVVSYVTARKDDADVHTFHDLVRRSAVNYPGTDKTLSTSYLMFQQVHELDPSTLAQWTIANVNLAEFGLELVS